MLPGFSGSSAVSKPQVRWLAEFFLKFLTSLSSFILLLHSLLSSLSSECFLFLFDHCLLTVLASALKSYVSFFQIESCMLRPLLATIFENLFPILHSFALNVECIAAVMSKWIEDSIITRSWSDWIGAKCSLRACNSSSPERLAPYSPTLSNLISNCS